MINMVNFKEGHISSSLIVGIVFFAMITVKSSEAAERFKYDPNEKSADDKKCSEIASTCPFLRSPTAKPVDKGQLHPVDLEMSLYANNFNGMDDLNQM